MDTLSDTVHHPGKPVRLIVRLNEYLRPKIDCCDNARLGHQGQIPICNVLDALQKRLVGDEKGI